MRQAGRYLPEYRRIRASHSILELCKRADLAAEVTLQPLEILDVDAAIIFADLLLPVEPMGLKLAFLAGEGPSIDPPIRKLADIEALSTVNSAELGYVGEAIAQVKPAAKRPRSRDRIRRRPFYPRQLHGRGRKLAPLPQHQAADVRRARLPGETLMDKLVEVLVPYAASQVAAGAEVIQVFDSWAGALSPGDYAKNALPYSRKLIRRIQDGRRSCRPLWDWCGTLPRPDAPGGRRRTRAGLANAPRQSLVIDRPRSCGSRQFGPCCFVRALAGASAASSKTSCAGQPDDPGHIFNLGHGILPETPVENVKAVVKMVRDFSAGILTP